MIRFHSQYSEVIYSLFITTKDTRMFQHKYISEIAERWAYSEHQIPVAASWCICKARQVYCSGVQTGNYTSVCLLWFIV